MVCVADVVQRGIAAVIQMLGVYCY